MSMYLVVGLLVVMYLVPELLRSRNQKYEYPEVPEREPVQTPPPFSYDYSGEGVSVEHGRFTQSSEGVSAEWQPKSLKSKVVMPVEIAVPHVSSDEDPWAGRLSAQDVLNGVIFAEILQPPRSKRRLECWRRLS